MAKYGLPFQGSKSAIADSIIKILPSGKRFVDLFGGGFAMSECAMRSGKYESVLYNELEPLLPALIQKAVNGDYNYSVFKPDFISKEQFDELKETDGYIKYIWSFSNSGDSYLFSKELEPKKKSLHNFVVFGDKDDFIVKNFRDVDKYVKGNDIRKRRILLGRYMKMKQQMRSIRELQQLQQLERLERLERLQQLERLEQLQQLQQLQQLEIRCGSYIDYKYRDGDIVYCDPPYEGVSGYSDNFNHQEFYDWVYSRDYPVYSSSYQISDNRFRMVWAKGKRNLMAGATNQKVNYECIYLNR